MRIQSDAGDYIGTGGTYNYTQANALISVTSSAGHVGVTVKTDETWVGDLATPAGVPLQPGTYSNVTRYPSSQSSTGAMAWFSIPRGCTTLTGTFWIDSLSFVDSKLTTIDFRFEQYCDGAAVALRGAVHWRSDDTTKVAGPVYPVPTGLWTPDPRFLPSSGNYVLLSADTGDYIGQGMLATYSPPKDALTVTAQGGYLNVAVAGWYGDFATMIGTTPLVPGYYAGLRRYPFHNQVKGGLSWYGNGRGCNTLTGWFAVDRVTYSGTTLTAIDLRFEQHCEGVVPALHGAIHWSG